MLFFLHRLASSRCLVVFKPKPNLIPGHGKPYDRVDIKEEQFTAYKAESGRHRLS